MSDLRADGPHSEATKPHPRIMQCTLEVESSRAYWQECGLSGGPVAKEQAFERAIFGSKTYLRVERVLADMRHRYDSYPTALSVLSGWRQMEPTDRVLICHWHTQLADPLYRTFTGECLVSRFQGPRPVVDRDMAITWLEQQTPGRWQYATKSKIASKMMTSAMTAGILATNRDPRPIQFPRVSDTALTYLMYLLREIEFVGTLLTNPYVSSVGLDADVLARRLRQIRAVGFRRQGELTEFQWQYVDLESWADAVGLCSTTSTERSAS